MWPGRKPHCVSSSFGAVILWHLFPKHLAYTFSREARKRNALMVVELDRCIKMVIYIYWPI